MYGQNVVSIWYFYFCLVRFWKILNFFLRRLDCQICLQKWLRPFLSKLERWLTMVLKSIWRSIKNLLILSVFKKKIMMRKVLYSFLLSDSAIFTIIIWIFNFAVTFSKCKIWPKILFLVYFFVKLIFSEIKDEKIKIFEIFSHFVNWKVRPTVLNWRKINYHFLWQSEFI